MAKREDAGSGGKFRFGSLFAFLTNDVPTRFRVKGPDRPADPFRTFERNIFAAYIQDDIHATSRLTLNLGLRYGFTTVPTERYGRLSNIRFGTDPGTADRNTLIVPGLAMVDLALTKKFSLAEKQGLEFRTEFFNLLNRANFGYPSVFLFNRGARLGSAGRITSTTTSARQIQFASRYRF